MLILVTYDVNTQTPDGQRRLRRVAKICTNYGQRVQNSVFECILDGAQLVLLQKTLGDIIDPARDSLRYYNLGEKYRTKVVHTGAKPGYDAEGVLML